MATLNQLKTQADKKIVLLVQAVEVGKIQNGLYAYQPPQVDGDITVFVNTATDKHGNAGYYICVTGQVGQDTWQKIVRQHADEEDSQDWFKLLTYV